MKKKTGNFTQSSVSDDISAAVLEGFRAFYSNPDNVRRFHEWERECQTERPGTAQKGETHDPLSAQ